MAKRFDVVATLKFKKKDGSEGKSYTRVGTAFEGEKGMSIKLDAVPVSPDWDGWLNLYEPKAKDGAQESPKSTPAPDEDLPF